MFYDHCVVNYGGKFFELKNLCRLVSGVRENVVFDLPDPLETKNLDDPLKFPKESKITDIFELSEINEFLVNF